MDTTQHTEANGNGTGRRESEGGGRLDEPAEVLVDALRRLFGARSDVEVRGIEREARERLAGAEDEARLIAELEESTAVAFEHVDRWNAVAERADMRTAELAVRTRELEDANAGVRELLDEATVRSEDLQAAVDYQRAILNTLAHEVRGPLTAGDLMLDEILSDHDLTGVEAENIADARRCIAEAVRIVNDQLQRAKLEAESSAPARRRSRSRSSTSPSGECSAPCAAPRPSPWSSRRSRISRCS